MDLALTSADIERYRQSQLAGREGDARRAAEERLRAIEFPKTLPAFQRLLIDKVGRLWVEDFLRPGTTDPRWTVFDVTGRPLGTVKLPVGFRLFEVGRDYVLGRERDSDGFARVRMYTLSAGGPAR